LPLLASDRVGYRHRRQQRLGVGVPRRVVEVGFGAALDQLAEIHHRHPIGDMPHHGEVMGDEDVRHAELFCSRSNRLITCACTDTSSAETGSSQSECPGDADALALTPGKLVWVAVEVGRRIQADQVEQFLDPVQPAALGHHVRVDLEGLQQDLPDAAAGVERGVRVL
jgi:hypothetical protein